MLPLVKRSGAVVTKFFPSLVEHAIVEAVRAEFPFTSM